MKTVQEAIESVLREQFKELQGKIREVERTAKKNGIVLEPVAVKKSAKKKKSIRNADTPSSKDVIVEFVAGRKDNPPYISDIQQHVKDFGYSEASAAPTVSVLVSKGILAKDTSEGPKKTRFTTA